MLQSKLSCSALFVAACLSGSALAQPIIADELCNGVAERVYWRYFDADATLRSYAAVNLFDGATSRWYCSGTMIGPNILLTAGHCGQGAADAGFRVYSAISGDCGGTDPGEQTVEFFPGVYLLHTWPDMDLDLYYCFPQDGVNPGDKYGYVDLDIVVDQHAFFDYTASRNKVILNKQLYSIWSNPIDDIGGQHTLYSEGMINNTNALDHWGNPNIADPNYPQFRCFNNWCVGGRDDGECCCGSEPCADGAACSRRPNLALGVQSNVWCEPGGSGSAQFTTDTHRILVAPTSMGGGPARTAIAIADHLHYGWADARLHDPNFCSDCPTCTTNIDQVNRQLLFELGVDDPNVYYGWVDENVDGIFDVQHDLELLLGEGQRDWYWLGFESVRRNALWTRDGGSGVAIDTGDPIMGMAELNTLGNPTPDCLPMLSHRLLNLASGRFYNVSFLLAVTQAQHASPIRVALEGGGDTNFEDFDVPALPFQTCVTRLWAPPGAVLRFHLKGNTLAYVTAVTVVEDPAPLMDFDMHDKRYMWINRNVSQRGLVWPNGTMASREIDWAGVVLRDPNRPLNDDWSLGNDDLAIDGGYEYRISFQHILAERDPLSAGSQGVMRVVDQSGPVAGSSITFTPSSDWSGASTGWFGVTGDDNDLQFGVIAMEPRATGAYLVDDITIERKASTTIYVDWRNDGYEDGTITNPFDTVIEGITAVEASGTAVIADGVYPENLTIDKALTLTATGGVATIGG